MNAIAQLEDALVTSASPTVGRPEPEASRRYLVVEEVAQRLRCSTRTIHELTRTNAIPHRRLAGSRRCLFRVDELEAWENGSSLDVRDLPRGGRVVTTAVLEDR
jgi:excisionase family DNA binding protein